VQPAPDTTGDGLEEAMTTDNPTDTPAGMEQPPQLVEQAQRGRQAWQQLALRLRSITPTQLARFALVAGTLAVIGWLLARSWPALIPFVVGAILAYALLPVVNGLDRLMPRTIAALLSMLAVLAILAMFIALLIPALARQYERLATVLPDAGQVETFVDDLDSSLETLPAPIRRTVVNALDRTAVDLRARLDEVSNNLPQLIINALLRLINIVGAILGLLVLPIWMLVVLTDQRKGSQATDQLLPVRMRSDFWAVVRILDRSFRAFFQKQVTQGLLTGFFVFLTTITLNALGLLEVEYPLVIALFVGLMELIPEIGPIVAVVLLGLAGLLVSPVTSLYAVVSFLIIHQLVSGYVDGRSVRKVREVHPALLIVAVVALSELGLFWVFLSVPIVTAFRDLFRYAHGRLSEPPRPAGLIPDEVRPAALTEGTRPATTQPLPLAYRRGRATRSSGSGTGSQS